MKKLIFVTSKYPFSTSETFIENEIEYLSKTFDKVYIYATEAHETDPKRPVPENVTVFAANPKPVSRKDYLTSLFNPFVIKEIIKNCLNGSFIRKISACCYFNSCFIKSSKKIPEFLNLCDINSCDNVTVYSYWLSTIGMCAIEIHDTLQKSKIKPKLVSRCHGYDVYSEDSYAKILPFQEQLIKRFENVFPCSKHGVNYLSKKYPGTKEKFHVAYLGVKDRFSNHIPYKSEVFNVVSCSNVIPSKRINLIVEALSTITNTNIFWTHFGDGDELESIKKQAETLLPKNIKYSFLGRVPNSEIYKFYNNNNINLFLNASTSEGVPVSIMEACSFGIPIVATDVGGISEIVSNGNNGLLLKPNFSIDDYAQAINTIINLSDSEYKNLCHSARNVFLENFDAKNSFTKFCEKITND